MLDVYDHKSSEYGCVFDNRGDAERYVRALKRDDPDKHWHVSRRLIRAGGFHFPVYIIHYKKAS